MINLTTFVSGWMILALSVLGLALYRKFVSSHKEDRYVHLSEGEARFIPHQIEVNERIANVDRWGGSPDRYRTYRGSGTRCPLRLSEVVKQVTGWRMDGRCSATRWLSTNP